MTTDPGDLVLDPTCGSGTTAFVAEKWGRRWITCDTSRVAVTLARQRLLTSSYDYFELKYPHEGLKGGFVYKTVPHVTLKSIANNPEIDAIHERLHPAVAQALAVLNKALRAAPPKPLTVTEGARKGRALDFALPASRTERLPAGDEVMAGALLEWEVPFDFPDGWRDALRASFDAFHSARQARQRAMDASIAAHADQETLYDQPAVARNRLRITGPFTVEAVPFPSVKSLDVTGEPAEADDSIARTGESESPASVARRTAENRHSRQGRAGAEAGRSGCTCGRSSVLRIRTGDAWSTFCARGCQEECLRTSCCALRWPKQKAGCWQTTKDSPPHSPSPRTRSLASQTMNRTRRRSC